MEKKVFRTLGFYQPFASLMRHGKLETRWVRKGRKPPFPLGEYLFYSTVNPCEHYTLIDWCGPEIMLLISQTLEGDTTRFLNRTALATGTLVNVRPMTKNDEHRAFVKFIGEKEFPTTGSGTITKIQWILEFSSVTLIEPFPFLEGKQGIGKYSI